MRDARRRNLNRSTVDQVVRISLVAGNDIANGAVRAMGAVHPRHMSTQIKFNAATNHFVRSLAKKQGFGLVIVESPKEKKHGLVPAILFKNEKALMLFNLKWCFRD